MMLCALNWSLMLIVTFQLNQPIYLSLISLLVPKLEQAANLNFEAFFDMVQKEGT